MTRKRHYHPLAALRFLRKTVLLCLLPLANALLEFSLSALLTALRQDAALLLFLCGASWVLLEASSWALDDAGVLRLRWAFAAKASLPSGPLPFTCTRRTHKNWLTASCPSVTRSLTGPQAASGRRWCFWGPTSCLRWPSSIWLSGKAAPFPSRRKLWPSPG